MDVPHNLLKDKLYITGLALLVISFTVFLLPELFANGQLTESFGIFFFHYALTFVYFILMLTARKFKRGGGNLPYIFLFMLIFLVSAYALNRNTPVFELSVNWVCVALVTYALTYIAVGFWDYLGNVTKNIISFILGSALLFFLYLTIYCIPVMPFALIGFFLLGFSLHAFVPLLFVFFTVKQLVKMTREKKQFAFSAACGFAVSLLIAVVFAVQWNMIDKSVNKNFSRSLIADNTDLPGWAKVAEHFPDNWASERYLKSKLVYSVVGDGMDSWEFGRSPKSMNETRKHDPLVMFASLFNSAHQIDDDDKIKVLEAVYDARHNTQERLWSGQNLHTTNVISNIRIWPGLRMAYTEKTITVSNINPGNNAWDREEAIYTFHLPEGAVVSSLSLWINGKEEKGVLTTLKKADSAYNEIVGVQLRDPSVIHWQEGNAVSVRVFPVMANDTRIFKIGITAPLRKTGSNLVYETAYFEGPDAAGAGETIQLSWAGEPNGFKMPGGFKSNGDHRYIKETTYDPDWQLTFEGPALDTKASFSFDGNSYAVQPYVLQRATMDLQSVYLDVNKAWKRDELEAVCKLFADCKVFVYTDNMVQLSEANKDDLFNLLTKQRFSIFPFFSVNNPANALIITKSLDYSPNLRGLKESDFMLKLKDQLAKGPIYKVFSLSPQLSPYLKSLKEHRVFCYEQGNMSLLRKLTAEKRFAKSIEDDNHIVIDDAELMLVKTKDSTQGKAPDHLMRLFTYNHRMQQLKSRISGDYSGDTTLIAEAEKAYVVTPVSSLIVLETQKDYDRFNIKKSADALDDATLKSKGAVPEPHEWALIIIAVIMGAWLMFNQKLKNRFSGIWNK